MSLFIPRSFGHASVGLRLAGNTASATGLRTGLTSAVPKPVQLPLGGRLLSSSTRFGQSQAIAVARPQFSNGKSSSSYSAFWKTAVAATLVSTAGTSVLLARRPLECESAAFSTSTRPTPPPGAPQSEPESILNLYSLSFSSICGVCAGIFIKKGLKFIAFLLGGGFVLLQYLNSQSVVGGVNWSKMGRRWDAMIDSAAGNEKSVGGIMGSKAGRIAKRFEDFLTANFQERATFLAALALGLRLG